MQKGTVRKATHTSVMVYLFPEIIKQFKRKFPECELQVVNRSRKDILSMLSDGEADIGICSLSTIPPAMNYEVFAKFARVLIAPKGHPLSKKSGITLKDIAQYPLILPPCGSNTRAIIDQEFKEKDLEYKIAMEITGREAIKTYVEMGLGVSFINEFYLTKEDRKDLFIRDVSNYFGQAERGIVTRNGKYLSKHITELLKILQE
ncbi:MAG: LysR family transcriptional regulator substrate-binding protein [Candidatus Omnitrophica bacterium]|nr:LysR family transcriptional regulator substrate-binding protein [Candidatus Omnitrophota bacterium]